MTEHNTDLVDAFQRTPWPRDIAVGDCAYKQDFFTRRPINALLGSQAAAEGRIAGTSIYALARATLQRGLYRRVCKSGGRFTFGVAGRTEPTASPRVHLGAGIAAMEWILPGLPDKGMPVTGAMALR